MMRLAWLAAVGRGGARLAGVGGVVAFDATLLAEARLVKVDRTGGARLQTGDREVACFAWQFTLRRSGRAETSRVGSFGARFALTESAGDGWSGVCVTRTEVARNHAGLASHTVSAHR